MSGLFALAFTASAQILPVQHDATTGAVVRPTPALFRSGNDLLSTAQIAAAYQPLDADLTTIAAANNGTALAAVTGTNTGDLVLAGMPDYITLSGQTITRGLIDLTTDVTGTLPAGNGGFDSTTIDSTTWSDGANASNVWTFDVSGTDHTMTAGDNRMTFSGQIYGTSGGSVSSSGNYAFYAYPTWTATSSNDGGHGLRTINEVTATGQTGASSYGISTVASNSFGTTGSYSSITGLEATSTVYSGADGASHVGITSTILHNSSTANWTNVYVFKGGANSFGTASGTITNLYGLDLSFNPTAWNGANEKVLTNWYGIRVGDQPDGVSTGYALYTGTGDVRFGDDVMVVGSMTTAGQPDAANSITISGSGNFIQFEGSTADEFELLLLATNPTADNIQTLIDASGMLTLKVSPPASAAASGKEGMWAEDDSFLYICTAANTWRRVAISTW